MRNKTMKFKKNIKRKNEILDLGSFYISYNKNLHPGCAFFQGDTNGEETALVRNSMYRILNGDYREQYEKIAPFGFHVCLKFYNKKRRHFGSSWTTNHGQEVHNDSPERT